MNTIHAIYENGVLRLLNPVSFPEGAEIAFEPRLVNGKAADNEMDDVYEILDRRYNSGHTDTAARHNEHQP